MPRADDRKRCITMHQEMLYTYFASIFRIKTLQFNPLHLPRTHPFFLSHQHPPRENAPTPPHLLPLPPPHHTALSDQNHYQTARGHRQRLRSHLRRWHASDIVGDIDFPTLMAARTVSKLARFFSPIFNITHALKHYYHNFEDIEL